MVCLIDPGAFREMHAFVQGSCDGMGRLDVVSLAATEEVPAMAAQQHQQQQQQEQPGDAALGQPGRLKQSSAGVPGSERCVPRLLPNHLSAHHHACFLVVALRRTGAVHEQDVDNTGRSSEHHSEPAAGQAEPPGPTSEWTAVYPRGPVAGMPDEHASRRGRFAELDELQPGWQVELRSRGAGGTVDAVFFSPAGKCSGLCWCKLKDQLGVDSSTLSAHMPSICDPVLLMQGRWWAPMQMRGEPPSKHIRQSKPLMVMLHERCTHLHVSFEGVGLYRKASNNPR